MAKRASSSQERIPFKLFAPYNKKVALIGNWNGSEPIPMKRNKKGEWQAEVELPDGQHEYKFQLVSNSDFAKGKTITVTDPEAVQLSADGREYAVVTVRDGKPVLTTYEWQHDDVPLPPNEQLVIYEMHLADFRGGPGDDSDAPGTFNRVIEKLDYLAELGINAIELMPLNVSTSGNHWGYSQCSFYALEDSYGTPDEFCRLVDECHARGIRVFHDGVYNHTAEDAFLAQIDHDYWYYRHNPDEEDLQFGPKLNYEFCDEKLGIWPAREYTIGAIQTWVQQFHLDGIRFDMTRALKNFDLMHWFNHESHNRTGFKPFYTIAEHLPQDPAVTGPDGPLDTAWHDTFYRQMASTILGVPHDERMPYTTDDVLSAMDGRSDGFASPYNTVHYLNNHDQERIMYLLGSAAGVFDDAAFRRCKMGASLLFTAPGIPMLWMGEEFGQANRKSEEREPLDWSLLENERNHGLWQHYRHLIGLRKANPALHSENFEVLANIPDRRLIAYKRWDEAGNVVVVAANLTDQYAGEFEIGVAGEGGRWREAIHNYEVELHDEKLTDTLGESEVKVYIKAG